MLLNQRVHIDWSFQRGYVLWYRVHASDTDIVQRFNIFTNLLFASLPIPVILTLQLQYWALGLVS
jgi:hypothetical protein